VFALYNIARPFLNLQGAVVQMGTSVYSAYMCAQHGVWLLCQPYSATNHYMATLELGSALSQQNKMAQATIVLPQRSL